LRRLASIRFFDDMSFCSFRSLVIVHWQM